MRVLYVKSETKSVDVGKRLVNLRIFRISYGNHRDSYLNCCLGPAYIFLRAPNPRKLFSKQKCENKGRRGKVDFWGHFGVPRSGIWPARSGKVREIGGDFPFSFCTIPEIPSGKS